jgi:hypothetical protein
MATYLDALTGDRERMRRALTALIEAEAATVRELQANLERYARTLDEQIVRVMVYRKLFGPSSSETLNAQTAVEEASKPHTATMQELAQRQRILQGLQEALVELERGEPSDFGQGATKLTVADILAE